MKIGINAAIDKILSSRSTTSVYTIGLVMLFMLGWLDYIVGDYSWIVFYLVPVALVTWFAGRVSGVLFCVLSLIARLIADKVATSFAFQFSTLHYWNMSLEFLFLLIMSLLFSVLKKNLMKDGKH